VEGGLIWGLSAAAWGEVVLGEGGEIVIQNFDRHPVVRMRSVPQIEVHLIESPEPPTGVGEVTVPSVAPALANAIAALTGTRIRQLPINKTIKIAWEEHTNAQRQHHPQRRRPLHRLGADNLNRAGRTGDRAP
jgi:CO/xanthine dehydrogenase Mo-binding subunit